MAPQDLIRKAQDLLAASDGEFAAGKTAEGSLMLWEAACAGLAAVATRRGLPVNNLEDLKALVRDLDDGQSGYPVHLANFNVAEGFRDNAKSIYWDDAEFKMGRQTVKKFVAHLTQRAGA